MRPIQTVAERRWKADIVEEDGLAAEEFCCRTWRSPARLDSMGESQMSARERLLRRRLLLLRWAAETRDEAQRLAGDLDPDHPVTEKLHRVAETCSELEGLLERSSGL